jgi:hypothetical protein
MRFIPTRVGNTSKPRTILAALTVHPHASGEHVAGVTRTVMLLGSSPREWGTLSRAQSRRRSRRFIPTRVGNTSIGCHPQASRSVHPHASGEHSVRIVSHFQFSGSSPREWGTHFFHPAEFRTKFNESKFYQIFIELLAPVRGERTQALPHPTPPEFFYYFPLS